MKLTEKSWSTNSALYDDLLPRQDSCLWLESLSFVSEQEIDENSDRLFADNEELSWSQDSDKGLFVGGSYKRERTVQDAPDSSEGEFRLLTDEARKRFPCSALGCGKSFSTSYNLRAHYRIHDGQLPYVCLREGCGRGFKWRSSLKSHTQAHHKEDELSAIDRGEVGELKCTVRRVTAGRMRARKREPANQIRKNSKRLYDWGSSITESVKASLDESLCRGERGFSEQPDIDEK